MAESERTDPSPAGPQEAANDAPAGINVAWTALIALGTGIIYYFSNPKPAQFYDYTFRVAGNFLNGSIGFTEKPPDWLNEFVPFEGFFYSVFPLGSVLSMVPFALLKLAGIVDQMPSALIAALCAAVSALFLTLIANDYEASITRTILMTAGILFGTWTWTNLTFGGAWQLALGFAMVGELGAIYFTVVDRRPLMAGAFFALGFGNRTEVLLTAPFLMYLTLRPQNANGGPFSFSGLLSPNNLKKLAAFCAVPFVLGISTLFYNYVRFNSFTDFGYARIPGVLNEPWYNHGIFSPYYIPRQIWEMLFKLWEIRDHFPLPVPNGFSSSILISSPFLILAFRPGARDMVLKYAAWAAVLVLCIVLWMHGNSGGWQFGYRYAIVCLPWLFLIMLENSPKKISPAEWVLYCFSFIANAYATWLFHWTENIKP